MPELALVTGGTGFLGRELLVQLRAKGLSCICISRKGPADDSTVTLDLERERAPIESLLVAQRPSLIFHLAATTTAPGSGIFTGNILPLVHVLDAIERLPGYSPRVVVAGSAAEYGDLGPSPIHESAREAPVTDYGVAKLALTRLALARRRRGQDIVVARVFNALGPGLPASLAPGRFVQGALAARAKGETTLTTGDLSPVRDYLDVHDIAQALLLLARTDTRETGGIVNVCSGQPTRMQDLLHEILRQLGMDVVLERDPRLSKGASEIPVSLGSSELFRRLTGNVLPFDLETSVSRLLAMG